MHISTYKTSLSQKSPNTENGVAKIVMTYLKFYVDLFAPQTKLFTLLQ